MSDDFNSNLIFDSVKKMIGFTKSYTAFDIDLLTEINMVFGILSQIGNIWNSDTKDSIIVDESTTWSSLGLSNTSLNLVKSYVVAKCRIAFDPPQSGILMQALKDRIAELEFRLNVSSDPGLEDEEERNE